ncbi:MAG: hypothetical protein IKX62_03505 [Bacteroidales bacterium]|nr:hypothetical protein [Bacteroidales bacterium]
MKTVYANTRHPRLIKWSSIAIGAAGVVCLVLYFVFSGEYYLFSAFYSLAYFAIFYSLYKLSTYTFDDEADTITFSQQKKYPLRLSDITSVIYKENRRGRFRHLFIHDSGTGFMEIRTSKENADRMVAQILKANPDAEVKHAHYL